jgi:hypothetical protein
MDKQFHVVSAHVMLLGRQTTEQPIGIESGWSEQNEVDVAESAYVRECLVPDETSRMDYGWMIEKHGTVAIQNLGKGTIEYGPSSELGMLLLPGQVAVVRSLAPLYWRGNSRAKLVVTQRANDAGF